jgi:23S rRNA (adenine2503-C2)-methyltransferase
MGQIFWNFDKFIALSIRHKQAGIQFSVHESNNEARKRLIPASTATLQSIGCLGEKWAESTGRKPFFNYCVHSGNASDENITELLENFNPEIWECTLSVICEKDNSMKNEIEKQIDLIRDFAGRMTNADYSIRIFNPAGQDDIGGGCGQLWYFQQWLNQQKRKQ